MGRVDSDKYSRYSYILRKIIITFIGLDIISLHLSAPNNLLIYTSLFMFIILNDYLRHRGFY